MSNPLALVEQTNRSLDSVAAMLATADPFLVDKSQSLLEEAVFRFQQLQTMLEEGERAFVEQLPDALRSTQKKLRHIQKLSDSATFLMDGYLRSAGLSQESYTAAGQVSDPGSTGTLMVEG